jgi:PKD repeat protein
MKAKFNSRKFKNAMILLVLLTAAVFAGSCRNNEVEIPPLTGPSGARLFLQIQANPDHLVIHQPGRPRETSDISIQLKNHLGQGVPGENLKLRILNRTLNEINIGRLSDFNVRTDASGFARVIYTAPDTSELLDATSIIIRAVLTNAAYPDEVTDSHEIELQRSSVDPGECAGDLIPQGDVEINPSNPVVNETVCFNASAVFPTAEEFFWSFGNGDTAETGLNQVACTSFDEDGTFTVSLIARSIDRDCGELSFNVVVDEGEPPSCTIIATPSTVGIGEDVNFIATTEDDDGDVRRFTWNFGDGSTQNTSRGTATHDYDEAGSFTVVLTITDDQGNTATCTTTVTVQEEEEGDPICAFTVSPTNILANTTAVSVNAAASDDDDGVIVTYIVDWGDGTTDTLNCPGGTCPTATGVPIINKTTNGGTYAAEGSFTVTLVVIDDDGNDSSCTAAVVVCPATGCSTGEPQCSDGLDNDGDGCFDFGGTGSDPGCGSANEDSELPVDGACNP